MTPEDKGKAFERMVSLVLGELKTRHLERVNFVEQPRISLYDGRVVIPDFDLRYRMHHAEERFLIECQDRDRSRPDISDKIRTTKSLSRRDKFIFIYAETIPNSTAVALESDGVLVMKFNEFVDFVAGIDMNLSAIETQAKAAAEQARGAYSHWSPESGDSHDPWVVDEPPPGWEEK